MNRKGTMSGMTEGIILTLLFVILLTAVLAHFNSEYNQSHSVGFDTTAVDDMVDSFDNQMNTAYDETGGEVEQTAQGLTLSSSWAIGKGMFKLLWTFVSGGWIHSLIVGIFGMNNTAGIAIATILRILFAASLIWGIVRLFFKITP